MPTFPSTSGWALNTQLHKPPTDQLSLLSVAGLSMSQPPQLATLALLPLLQSSDDAPVMIQECHQTVDPGWLLGPPSWDILQEQNHWMALCASNLCWWHPGTCSNFWYQNTANGRSILRWMPPPTPSSLSHPSYSDIARAFSHLTLVYSVLQVPTGSDPPLPF